MSTPVNPRLSASNPAPEAETAPPEDTEATVAPIQGRVKSWKELRSNSILSEYQMWMAPFPPPQAVLEYEEILPGTWDRLLKMAEEAQSADILIAQTDDDYAHRDFRRGQIFGILVMFAAMGCAIYCVKIHEPWVGAAFLSMTVMAAAKSFILSFRGRNSTSEGQDHEGDGE